MVSIASISSLVLDFPPCCVEFWPGSKDWAVVGTYLLEKSEDENCKGEEIAEHSKKTQERNGSLVLLSVEAESVTVLQTLPTPFAILDIHFDPFNSSILVAATSTGSVALYTLNPQSLDQGYITHSRTIQFFPLSSLITSFVFHPSAPSVLACTLSTNATYLLHIPRPDTPVCSETVQVLTHDLEAWITAFAPDGSGLFSGADDAALRYVSLPQFDNTGVEQSISSVLQQGADTRVDWAERKIHGAGVTAVLPLTSSGKVCITGSYDDYLRVVYVPKVGRRRVLAEENLGGGVWRVKTLGKWRSEKGFEMDLLVCCMYAGVRLIRLRRIGGEGFDAEGDQDGKWELEVIGRFEEHKSMNYGCDVVRGKGLVVSTSFYDRLVCLWRLPKDTISNHIFE
ncbi:WD40 repeat-like protein [Pseudovirgaria hyperparasitica]|uniref:methylated diphthine methylhydrolase n=1 Tax=Pseudovirgaria hyperparasitica TaxID=470096 RepID=A0A6A6WD26_9PEZI|nr:WD40 repeat-like protein [Pseudovirgaria hyperparasitica]KAF2760079.1 WD40 repeat-like protein [Pseudovirgaria hyperparasitica]